MKALAALLATALLGGCASLVSPTQPTAASPETASCARWFAQVDAAIDQAGVRDAETERVAGFAGLRVDRFTASLRDRASASAAAFDTWLARLQRLELDGRGFEIANLPRTAFPIGAAADAAAARRQTEQCAQAWRGPLQSDPALRSTLLERAQVPDRYATWQRAVGLYPLVRWPFFAGVQNWQRSHEEAMSRWATSPAPTQRFVPARAAPTTALWHARPRDALGVPQFSDAEVAALLAAHAPALEVETRGDADRFGALAWNGGAVPAVDRAAPPQAYQRIAYARYGDRVLVQLVYSFWFPERPPLGRVDLLAGALDAVVLRVTLAPDDGRPLLVDTIHGCGCYHLFIPTAEVALRTPAPTDVEWAFTPTTLPALSPGQRIVVRLASATHYVVGVDRDGGAPGTPYVLREEQMLRALPTSAGASKSVFGPDGLVAGSERAERWLFWPMGIASAGAMRQWGHHATAFVGRRHFDDADLIERRFVIPALQ